MNKCIVNSYKNFIRQYVTYLVKNASKFKNFVVDVINMFKPVYIYHLGRIAGTARALRGLLAMRLIATDVFT